MLDLWDDYGTDGAYLASCLQLKDNFATQVEVDNDEGVDFYLLLCTKHCKEELHVCLGQKIRGWGHGCGGEVLLEVRILGPKLHIFSQIGDNSYSSFGIIALKFLLVPQIHRIQGNDPVYALPVRIEGRIRHTMEMVDYYTFF